MPPRSSNSAAVRWADPEAVASAVRRYADALRREHPGISRVLWYGSWVTGGATAASDVDLCIVVQRDDRRMRDRIPDYLPDRFPQPVDLVVVTPRELAELAVRAPSWHRAILAGTSV